MSHDVNSSFDGYNVCAPDCGCNDTGNATNEELAQKCAYLWMVVCRDCQETAVRITPTVFARFVAPLVDVDYKLIERMITDQTIDNVTQAQLTNAVNSLQEIINNIEIPEIPTNLITDAELATALTTFLPFDVVDTVADLRAYAGNKSHVLVLGHLIKTDGLGAVYTTDGSTQIATSTLISTQIPYDVDYHDDGYSTIVNATNGTLYERNDASAIETGWRAMIDAPDFAPVWDVQDRYAGSLREYRPLVNGTSRQAIGMPNNGIIERAFGFARHQGFKLSNLNNKSWAGSFAVLVDLLAGQQIYEQSSSNLAYTREEVQLRIDAAVAANATTSTFHPSQQTITVALDQSWEVRTKAPFIDGVATGQIPNEYIYAHGTNHRVAPIGTEEGEKFPIIGATAGAQTTLNITGSIPVGARFVCSIPNGGKFKRAAGVARAGTVNGTVVFNWNSTGETAPTNFTDAFLEVLDVRTQIGAARFYPAIAAHYAWVTDNNDDLSVVFLTELPRIATLGSRAGRFEDSRTNLALARAAKYLNDNGLRTGFCDIPKLLSYNDAEFFAVLDDETHATIDEVQDKQAYVFSNWRFPNLLEYTQVLPVNLPTEIVAGDLLVATGNGTYEAYDQAIVGSVLRSINITQAVFPVGTAAEGKLTGVLGTVDVIAAPGQNLGAEVLRIANGVNSVSANFTGAENAQALEQTITVLRDWAGTTSALVGSTSLMGFFNSTGQRIATVEAIHRSTGTVAFRLRTTKLDGTQLLTDIPYVPPSNVTQSFTLQVVRGEYDGGGALLKEGWVALVVDDEEIGRLYGVDRTDAAITNQIGQSAQSAVNNNPDWYIGSITVNILQRRTLLGLKLNALIDAAGL